MKTSWKLQKGDKCHKISDVVPGVDAWKFGNDVELRHKESNLKVFHYTQQTRLKLDVAEQLVQELVKVIEQSGINFEQSSEKISKLPSHQFDQFRIACKSIASKYKALAEGCSHHS